MPCGYISNVRYRCNVITRGRTGVASACSFLTLVYIWTPTAPYHCTASDAVQSPLTNIYFVHYYSITIHPASDVLSPHTSVVIVRKTRNKMENCSFQTELVSIMEILAKAAVAEINRRVDDSCAVLRLEISQSQSDIYVLKKKCDVMEAELKRSRIRAKKKGIVTGIQKLCTIALLCLFVCVCALER